MLISQKNRICIYIYFFNFNLFLKKQKLANKLFHRIVLSKILDNPLDELRVQAADERLHGVGEGGEEEDGRREP